MLLYEPAHDKTNKMACAPSEDSDQPGHPKSTFDDVMIHTRHQDLDVKHINEPAHDKSTIRPA